MEIFMETYIDVYVNVDGEKSSVIFKKLTDIGLKHNIGEHDFVYDWGKVAPISDELELADKIHHYRKLNGIKHGYI